MSRDIVGRFWYIAGVNTTGHRTPRRAACLALAALLLQLIIPLVHTPPGSAASGARAHLNMCVAAGAQPVQPVGGQGSPGRKAPAQRAPACSICLTLHLLSGGVLPPVEAGIALAHSRREARVAVSSDPDLPAFLFGDVRARAPPAV